MKRLVCALLCWLLCPVCALGESGVGYAQFFADLAAAYKEPTSEALQKIDADAAAMADPLAPVLAECWKLIFVPRDSRPFLYGTDDPALLPISGQHAFAVLGHALVRGKMTQELAGRCEAAAAAARAFPDSLLICSGGATGSGNPQAHTEAGLMKAYLINRCGIAADRIATDEYAMNTADNARNVLAIVKERGIESLTIVTSAYHQKRSRLLFQIMAEKYRLEQDYAVEIAGSYCFAAKPAADYERLDCLTTLYELGELLNLPKTQLLQVANLLYFQ